MPRTAALKPNNEERDEQITRMREHIPEGSTILTLARSSQPGATTHLISCFIVGTNDAGLPDLVNLDAPVASILGYKCKQGGENDSIPSAITVMGYADTIGVSLVSSLSFAVFGSYDKYSHRWL